jgi:hypothetical protein
VGGKGVVTLTFSFFTLSSVASDLGGSLSDLFSFGKLFVIFLSKASWGLNLGWGWNVS